MHQNLILVSLISVIKMSTEKILDSPEEWYEMITEITKRKCDGYAKELVWSSASETNGWYDRYKKIPKRSCNNQSSSIKFMGSSLLGYAWVHNI